MLTLLILLLSLHAHAADTLGCAVARASESLSVEKPILEGTAALDANSLDLRLDASLSPSSFFLVLQDDKLQKRVAFTASASSVSEQAALMSGSNSVRCRQSMEKPAGMPVLPPEKEFLVCMLDEAQFKNGSVESAKRRLTRVFSPLQRSIPISLTMEDAETRFTVKIVSFDPFRGLDAEIQDKKSGENAHFVGPARSLSGSFMLGLTLGNRDTDARFLRLGCLWTDDTKPFKEL